MQMSNKTRLLSWLSVGRRSLVLAILALVFSGVTAPVVAQDPAQKTISERLKEYWAKLVARMESSSKAAGDEYHKLKDEAARASGPAREKMAAEMEILGRKWAIAREKLATTLEIHMNTLGEEVRTLEEKAGHASGSARDKMAAEREKLHDEWLAARAKLEATLSANLKSSRDQIEHLKAHAADLAGDARAKLGPHMERLKAEAHKDREKLAAYLEADLKRTEEDLKKLGEATSDAAHRAKEKLSTKYHELKAKIEDIAREKASEESR
jgi:polyhydroxyalkanoate synthesis regulator phasin